MYVCMYVCVYVCMLCMYVCMWTDHDGLRVLDGLRGQIFPIHGEQQLGLLGAPAAGHGKRPPIYRAI
jgi:hypothetical protein